MWAVSSIKRRIVASRRYHCGIFDASPCIPNPANANEKARYPQPAGRSFESCRRHDAHSFGPPIGLASSPHCHYSRGRALELVVSCSSIYQCLPHGEGLLPIIHVLLCLTAIFLLLPRRIWVPYSHLTTSPRSMSCSWELVSVHIPC
jgi:hypothetical protein